MRYLNDNGGRRPLIQVLVPALRTVDQPGMSFAWLNGYCLLSCRLEGHGVILGGEVRIGEHLADNPSLIASLADALDPAAVLAGMDLTSVVSGLGRLPFDAPDQAPALAVLTKLRSMLEHHKPIDLGQPDGDGLDRLNPSLLAEMLADQAGACLLALSQTALPDVHQGTVQAAWQKWRQSLVPVLPEKEVPEIFEA